ncbi:facilitated trehalose transporter Tret1-like [Bicyclus anynana]|uniref:Facilitated trehalose transporter Tret1-like n=1 Tax=Bicyclus anynana TaxID=110368 RepID=A0A6J1NBC9_BICAN|nr:facilitated trehalose transporter Tret1-like [Bicyclus anynana]
MNTPIIRQMFVVSSMLLAGISTGGIMGVPSVMLQQLKKNDSLIEIDLDTESWIASVHGFAGIPSILIPYLMQFWGRRFGFRFSCLAVLIGWITLCFANSSLVIIIAEIFQGAGVKSLLLVGMVIISEMVEPKIRNQSIALYGVIQTFVVLIIHTAGNYVHWKTISLTMCFPLSLAIIFTFIYPESPAWLAYKGRFEESKKSFVWLRGKNKESLVEMNALFTAQRDFLRMEMSTKYSNRSKPLMRMLWRKISARDFYLPIFHMFVLQSCYYWSGNLLIVVYAINLVGKVIDDSDSAFVAMILIDIAFIIGNVSCPILLRYFGNKTIMLPGGALSILFLLCTSAVLYLQEIGTIASDSTLCLYFLVGFMVCSSTAVYMIPFGVTTEIVPLRHRDVAGSFFIIIMSVSYTTSLKVAPYLIIHLGIYGIFLLYAAILTCCLLWVWKYVPETRNKTLQSIEEHFIKSNIDSRIVDEEINENVHLNNIK